MSSVSPDATRVPSGFDLQGHRGARGLAPENTIPAFRRALEIGVTTLEMDVVLSRDEKVVVSHEPWMSHKICTTPSGDPVSRRDERSHNLYQMTYAEIEQYDCGQRRHPDFPGQVPEPAAKPLLREVIGMAEAYVQAHNRSPVFYNVEIKARAKWNGTYHPPPVPYAERVMSTIHEEGVAARTIIQSFDPRVLRAARRLRDDCGWQESVRLSFLVGQRKGGNLSDQLDDLGFTPEIYGPEHHLVDGMLLREAHDRGIQVVPWTVNDRAAMRRLIHIGVEGLITDYPNVAREVLRELNPTAD